MFGFGHLPEILILLVLALLVFGPKRMIEMGSSVGKAFREFRESVKDIPGMSNVANLGGLIPDDPPTPTTYAAPIEHTPTVTIEPSAPSPGETAPSSTTGDGAHEVAAHAEHSEQSPAE